MAEHDEARRDPAECAGRTSRELIARDRALIRQVLAATRALRSETPPLSAPARWLACLTEARRAGNADEAERRRA